MPTARTLLLVLTSILLWTGCGESSSPSATDDDRSSRDSASTETPPPTYATVELDVDVSSLSATQKEMVSLLIEAAQSMDAIFWEQTYGNRDSLLYAVEDPTLQRLVEINYGPWDRLDDNEPFLDGVGPRPPGANFYPANVPAEEVKEAAQSDESITDPHTVVRRLPDGSLTAIPYHKFFVEPIMMAAGRLDDAAALTENERLRHYLERRSEALTSGNYRPSTRAWMNVTDSDLDIIIGSIETDEDQLFENKTAAEALVLLRDRTWDEQLARYAERLPALQEGLPVPDAYKQETPARTSDLGVYDVLYAAGNTNAGPKPIALHRPTDDAMQEEMGTRRLHFKNAVRAKFNEILSPTADVLLADDRRDRVTFDASLKNTLFHETAHDLGVTRTVSDGGSVASALKDHHTTLEELKADVLGHYVVQTLAKDDALDGERMDHYTTYLASLFRSVRFGAASAQGRANLVRFNYFRENGAVSRDDTGTYAVNADSLEQAVKDLSREILTLQGDGDYAAVATFLDDYGTMPDRLQSDLDRLDEAGVPVDVTYEQGPSVLQGLEPATAAN